MMTFNLCSPGRGMMLISQSEAQQQIIIDKFSTINKELKELNTLLKNKSYIKLKTDYLINHTQELIHALEKSHPKFVLKQL